MKPVLLLVTFALQVWAAADGDPESKLDLVYWTKELMIESGRWADDMILEEIGGYDGLVTIKRGGLLVGYHYTEYTWEHKDLAALNLSTITRITYGAPRSNKDDHPLMEITDANEIALWVAAYKNHTEHQSGHTYFVPLSPQAGFTFAREEVDYNGMHMCDLGVRFYSAEKIVLLLSGHLHENSIINFRIRNRPLHLLVKARMPAPKEAQPYDPFSDPDGNLEATESKADQ